MPAAITTAPFTSSSKGSEKLTFREATLREGCIVKFRNVCALLFLGFLLSLQSLNAQTAGTGALTGTIKDPSGAVVPSATVTLTSIDTGVARTTTTGAD